MNTDFEIGDYLDINGKAIRVTAIEGGELFHDGNNMKTHWNIVLNENVLSACGFVKEAGGWRIQLQNAIITCEKELAGTYRVRIMHLQPPFFVKRQNDILVLSVLQGFIREECSEELPIDAEALTKAINK